MDNPLFVFSPLYVTVGAAIVALVVREYFRFRPRRPSVHRHSHHHHHHHHDGHHPNAS